MTLSAAQVVAIVLIISLSTIGGAFLGNAAANWYIRYRDRRKVTRH